MAGQAVRLRYVEVQGFRSIYTRQRVDFDEAGLTLLRGESGDGKSSLFLAIAYALDFCPIPATALQNWEADSPALEVEVGLSSSLDGDVVVVRGAERTTLKVGQGKPLKAIKSVKERLQQVLGGLPSELRSALTYRGQRKPGLFLSMTDGEKKDFLTQVLDLGKYEQQIASSEKNVTSWQGLYDTAESKAKVLVGVVGPEPLLSLLDEDETFDAGLAAKLQAEDLKYKLGRAEHAVHNAQLNEEATARASRQQFDAQKAAVQAEIDAIWATLTAFTPDCSEKSRLALLLENCGSRVKSIEDKDCERRQQVESEKSNLYITISGMRKRLGTRVLVQQRFGEKTAALMKVRKEECPTCLRPWQTSGDLEEKLVAEVGVLQGEIDALRGLEESLSALDGQYKALQFAPDPLLAQLQSIAEELRRQLAAEEQKISSAKYLYQADVEKRVAEAESRQAVLEAQAQRAYVSIVSDPARESKRLQDEVCAVTAEYQAAGARIVEIAEEHRRRKAANEATVAMHERWQAQSRQAGAVEAEADEARQKLNAEKDYLAMLKGFLGGIFAEILDEISDEANKLLGSFPNTADCTIRFVTDKTNKDGTVRQSITAMLTMGTHEADVRYHASGGQLTSVELAVDIAVGKVISRRTGTYLSWLVLDESFNGHTKTVKESCLEILQRHAQDHLILIVDHATEFREMFTRFVDVERIDGRTIFSGGKDGERDQTGYQEVLPSTQQARANSPGP